MEQKLLRKVRAKYTRGEIGRILHLPVEAISRWEAGRSLSRLETLSLQRILSCRKESLLPKPAFSFGDLFAGIGGMRLGAESAGGDCVWTCEADSHANATYLANFSDDHLVEGDIRGVASSMLPKFDLLLAGFPCQPFSLAGVSKKNSLGMPHGFQCKTKGTLFFEVVRVLRSVKPLAFLLENVKNLLSHKCGETFQTIRDVLEKDLGYELHWKVINGNSFVPQNRERLFLVGFREPSGFSWEDVVLPAQSPRLVSALHPQDGSEEPEPPYTVGKKGRVNRKYVLSDRLWGYLQGHAEKHQRMGNGFGYGLFGRRDVSRTLSARYFKDGSEILIRRGGANPRRLTPRECGRLMGFPDLFRIPVSDTQAYKQFGNSVVVPLVAAIVKAMKPHLLRIANRSICSP